MTYISEIFDQNWYLDKYPDVKAAKIDPFHHYLNHGRYEGRFPCQITILDLEKDLWQNKSDHTLNKFEELISHNNYESAYAAWILAKWNSSYGDWEKTLHYVNYLISFSPGQELLPHLGPVLLKINALINRYEIAAAKTLISDELTKRGDEANLLLAMSSIEDSTEGVSWINKLYKSNNLQEIELIQESCSKTIDNLSVNKKYQNNNRNVFLDRLNNKLKPLVSIIMPVFNAEDEIKTAIRSLLDQTWQNIEIIIVDDASSDNTFEIVCNLAKNEPRITVIQNDYNQGPYACRNKGLKASRGNFITVHDSDDWSHPQKIELQVNAIVKNKNKLASMSHMVRCTTDMYFYHWYIHDSWIYLNTSSLMFRRSVFKKLGFWDRVRVGGDSEYYSRIIKGFGEDTIEIVKPGIPLSFARIEQKSLSNDSTTHLKTLFYGVRKEYKEFSGNWHVNCSSIKDLYVSDNPVNRPFPIPQALRAPPHEDTVKKHVSLLQQSELFDSEWYNNTYPDIAKSVDVPLMHYILHGGYEGRDPGSDFSSSGYSWLYLQDYPEIINPLAHYLTKGKMEGNQTLPEITGSKQNDKEKKTILVCAHSSGDQVFGAERSLLDVLDGLHSIGFNSIVTLPKIANDTYLHEILARSVFVKVLPYSWWTQGRSPCQATVNHFKAIVTQHDIQAVYGNTIMLWEPLLAAREMQIPNYLHIRELPEQDPELCRVVEAEPKQIREHVLELGDHIIANSNLVSQYFNLPEHTRVVHNLIDVDQFNLDNNIEAGKTVVAMLSSNLPKKGVEDFIMMAQKLTSSGSDIQCLLIGPENEYTGQLNKNSKTNNLEITGYLSTPQEALSRANIVVNLSHFQESFGRTILEAMAARRCVMGYDWGALPELIIDGENGYLVPYRDIDALVDKLVYLHKNPELIITMGEKGRQIAEDKYSFKHFTAQLKQAFGPLLEN